MRYVATGSQVKVCIVNNDPEQFQNRKRVGILRYVATGAKVIAKYICEHDYEFQNRKRYEICRDSTP